MTKVPPDRPRSRQEAPWRAWGTDTFVLAVGLGVQALVPLVMAGLFARRLGPGPWGHVAMHLSVAALLAALPNYGFAYTAPRTIAATPPAQRAAWIAGIAGARLMLTVGAFALAGLLLYGRVGPLRWDGMGVALLGLVAVQGLRWGWAFEGSRRFRAASVLMLAGRLAIPLVALALVQGPGDAPLVLVAFSIGAMVEAVAGGFWLRRVGLLIRPTEGDIRRALRDGALLFGGQLAVLTYVAANPLWLGLLVSPEEAGVYAPAEQLARGLSVVWAPVGRTLVVRLSEMGAPEADVLLRKVQKGALLGGALLTGLLLLGASLVPLWLGPSFGRTQEVLQILSPLPALVLVSQVLGVQGPLARRSDGQVALLLGAGALTNLLAALVLAPRFGATGIAAGVVLAEAVVAALAVRWSR